MFSYATARSSVVDLSHCRVPVHLRMAGLGRLVYPGRLGCTYTRVGRVGTMVGR